MIVKPPTPLASVDWRRTSIFLAGSIEMGAAEDWQSQTTKLLREHDMTVLNPRRDDWDATWEQSMDAPQFREQVQWELEALERADVILMHFCLGTYSPISLLELGLFARSGKLVVSCPPEFWRHGNVHITCVRHRVPLYPDLDHARRAALNRAFRIEGL